MCIIRSFNTNHPNTPIKLLKGGVVGGSLIRGAISVNTDVLIYPGYITQNNQKWQYCPLRCKIMSINSDKTNLKTAVAGGLIGIQLDIDPALSANDMLVGQCMMPTDYALETLKIYDHIEATFTAMAKLVELNGLVLTININANNILCSYIGKNDEHIILKCEKPVCVEIGDKFTLSQSLTDSINIIGFGSVVSGIESSNLNFV
jgi:translation initiation factor 2 subunit 3